MLTTLLESRSHQTRNSRGAIASVTVHAAIILGAVYATATGASAKDKPDRPTIIHWVPTPEPRSSAATTPAPRRASHTATAMPKPVLQSFPVDVPTSLPSIDVPLAPIASEFVPTAIGDGDSSAGATTVEPGSGGRHAYDVSEVETAVAVIGNTVPEYPPAQRSSGIEGSVAAEFVVTESGRADVGSLRIVSAANNAFAESIRRALPRMRFRAAEIGGRKVPQLVRQNFVFRLDR
jgi:TonB family protein